MKKPLEEKTGEVSYYIDSSDDEAEDGLLADTKPLHKADYFNYLFKKLSILGQNNGEDISLVQHETNINTSLALLINNFADRLFRDSEISRIYKVMKPQLAITHEQYKNTLSEINKALTGKKELMANDEDPSKGSTVKHKIKQLNRTFLKEKSSEFLDISKINLESLNHEPFILKPINGEGIGAAKVLALSKLANRTNKDMLKFLATQKMDWDTVSSYHFPLTYIKNFGHINQFHYATGKVQISTPTMGSYNDIMESILEQPATIIKKFVERIFSFVRGEDLTKSKTTWITDLGSNYNARAEQIAYLFFIEEMQRNTSTLFTSPMFLELIVKNPSFISVNNFPMALPRATDLTRDIYHANKDFLPNPNSADYGQHSKQGYTLLKSISNLMVQWYSNLTEEGGAQLLLNIISASRGIIHIGVFSTMGARLDLVKIQENFITMNETIFPKLFPEPKAQCLALLKKVLDNDPPRTTKRKVLGDSITIDLEKTTKVVDPDPEKTLEDCKVLLNKCQKNMEKFIRENNMNLKLEMIKFIQILSKKLFEWYKIDVPERLKIEIPPEAVLSKLMEPKEKKKEKEEKKEKTGEALAEHEDSSPWFKYTEASMNEILKLRLDSIKIGAGSVAIVNTLTFDGTSISAKYIAEELSSIEINSKLLVILNLYHKHWVGIVVEKSDSEVRVTYMDPEQKSFPKVLKEELREKFSNSNLQCKIDIVEAELEIQKYNNCGLEVIENFVAYLTGDRLSQDDALLIHSALFEDMLLEHHLSPNTKLDENTVIDSKLSKYPELFNKLASIYRADEVLKLGSLIPYSILYEAIDTQDVEFLGGALSLD